MPDREPPAPPLPPSKAKPGEDRLARALRENLRRRKAQAKARAASKADAGRKD